MLLNITKSIVLCLVIQSCLTLCDPMDCSPPGSAVHVILYARTLEWVAMPSSRGSSQPKIPTLQGDSLPSEPSGKPNLLTMYFEEINSNMLLQLKGRGVLASNSGGLFNITVFNIQVYAPTSNAEEAEVKQFYEDLQDLLELTPKKDVPLQYSWASLVAQPVKNPHAMRELETWVRSLVAKNPWRRERLPTPVFGPGEFHGLYSPWGQKELDTTEQLSLSL